MNNQIEESKKGSLSRKSRELQNSDMSDYQKQLWIRKLTQTEGCFESPINITITKSKEIELPPLEWTNFELPPKKSKVTNTGQTIIFSAKWGQERPHISKGPFLGKYVFSNWHLHWGHNDMEGSEHTIDGTKYPAEMHVVTFKSCYLTQEAALKEQDGCATLVYMFKLQDAPNPAFQAIVDALLDIPKAGTSKKIEPSALTNLMKTFTSDYFMYWGSVSTEKCIHYILWLISRTPIGVSSDQIDALRFIFDEHGNPLVRNFREVNEHKRSIFHVNPSSSKYSTLLPLSQANQDVVQLYRCNLRYDDSANINEEYSSVSQVELRAEKYDENGRKLDWKKYIYETAMNDYDSGISQDEMSSSPGYKIEEETLENNRKKYIFSYS